MDRQFKILPIEGGKITQENGAVFLEGYANTKNQADRYGDVPTVYAAKRDFVYDLKEYLRNPVLLVDHVNAVDHVAGSMTEIREDERGLYFKAKFSNSDNPVVANARQIYTEGHAKGISIAGKFHYENPDEPNQLTLAEIYEISLVAVPADPDALAEAVQKALKSLSEPKTDGGIMETQTEKPSGNAPDINASLGELRKTLETRLEDCITKEKAEKIVEDIVKKLHPQPSGRMVPPQTPEEVMERAEAFKSSPRNTAEKAWTSDYGRKFGNMRNFLLAAKERHPTLTDAKAVMAEGTAAAGGYLVPTEFYMEVVRLLRDASPIMQIANVLPMSTWKRLIPRQLSNVSVGWITEAGAKPVANVNFGQVEQVAKVMAAVVKCTDELLRDSAINLTAFLSELISEAMALEIERIALSGNTANGDPFNGILNSSGVNAPGMAGASVCFDDIIEMLYSLNASYAQNATIALNRNGLKKLLKLKDSQGRYLWQPPAGNVPATIWDVPYVICPTIPNNLGANTDMTAAIFGRFNKALLISPREGIVVRVSQDAYDAGDSSNAFMQDQTWLRFTQALSIDVAQPAGFSYLQFK
ncbi:MAG: phage major capsid protein [Elusimicrobiales bacterium]|nr:phage major capsid protein [Elusimicrobiales bacterium]